MICCFIAAYLTYDVLRLEPHERFDGPGGFLGVILLFLLASGAGLGLAVRILDFFLAYKKIQRKFYWVILLLAPFLLAGVVSIPSYYQQWQTRPPSSECLHDVADLRIGQALLKVPTFPIISVALDDGNKPVHEMDILHFLSNKSLRKLCSMSDNGQTEIFVNAISVNFSRTDGERYRSARFKEACENGNYFFCKNETYFGVVPYIESSALYYDGHYNADKMYGGAGDTLINELRTEATNQSYFKYNFIKIDGLRGQHGNGVTFRCRDASANLFCQTNVSFSDDIRLIAGYVVSHKTTKNDLRKLYNDTYNFLDSMSVSEVNNGRPH